MINRLQFRHHNEVFNSKEDAREYIYSQIRFAESGLSVDNRALGYSLLAEPTILLYKNEEDETNPHLMLAIGSQTNESVQYSDNRFCIIDIDATEQEIVDLEEKLDKAIKSLTLIALSSDTLNFYSDKTDNGTYVSGDVKVADAHIFDDVRYKNNLMVTPEGLFIYVNLTYDEAAETFTFTVSNADGTLSNTSVKLPNNYLVSGHYDERDESIHLQMKEGEEVIVDCEKLIDEWGVEGDASSTPVVLTKEEIDYGISGDSSHYHTEPWQDVLRADVRIKDETKVLQQDGTYKYVKDENSTNILNRTNDGRYLYVDGVAKNIIYYMNGEKSNVKEALDELQKIKLSSDSDNILINKVDGFFASSKLEYISSANKLIFKTSGHPDKEIQLNSVELFERVYYDPTREVLVLTYKDSTGQTQFVEVPIGEMIRDWEWEPLNEGHNVKIVKKRNVSGNDKVSADVKIYDDPDNILVDKNHELFVKGTADNIKYEDGTVKDTLDGLKATDVALDNKINIEIARAEAAETVLDNKIGSGFTDDPHENVTYKFEQLQNQVNEEAEKLQQEIDRSTAKDDEHDGKIQTIENEIGEGFGPRNTVRDEIDNLQSEIDTVSSDTQSRLTDVINEDHSIDVETRNDNNNKPTIKVVSVNLSEEVEDNKPNIIKLNADGLYVGVDLIYEFNEETGSNQLIFKTTNGTKVYDLKTNSVVDKIYYDPTREAIIIEYTVNGHRMPDVVIPVGDLINEWRVEDGHPHAVQLEKVRESGATQDVLKASVVITDDHDDNILVMDDGALYVPANTDVTRALSAAIVTEKEEREDADRDLEDAIQAEETRAKLSETTLSAFTITAINDEKSRALSAEGALDSAITVLDYKITHEIERSTEKDNEHDAKISELESSAITLNNSITEERIRAMSAETDLREAIEDEATRATSADSALQAAIIEEKTRALSAETDLQNAIENEEERRINSDDILQSNILTEKTRAEEREARIESDLSAETINRQNADRILDERITAETLRAQETDAELYQKIADEKTDRVSGDTILLSMIGQEALKLEAVSGIVSTEITRLIDRDASLADALSAETTERIQHDRELYDEILASILTVDDTASVDLTKTSGNVVTADVKLQGGDNIIKLGSGLYASVHLSYDPGTNKIKLVTSNGTDEEIQLVGASLLEDLHYDPIEKELVITYKDATGIEHTISFGVEELFNDWEVKNLDEKSAVELWKTPASAHTAGSPDILNGRVLITDDHDGDGKPDQGSDNIIEIRNNGLYVNGSALSAAAETAECVANELNVLEKVVIGHQIDNVCGSGYTYEPNNMAQYINSAQSFNNADFILDQAIKNVDIKVDIVSAKTDCIDEKSDKLYELLYGDGATMPECGEGATYQPYVGACIISAATSFNEADQMLNDQICQILTMWASAATPTNDSTWVEDGANRKLQVDARLSHGNMGILGMSDESLVITTTDGVQIEPGVTEFTDTNVLRVVNVTEGPGGGTLPPDYPYNGLYVSNEWDCGMYYGDGDEDAKAAAEAAGYNTNYTADNSSSAHDFNYMNNVRQHDPLN